MCSTGVPSALIICAVWFTASGGEDKIVVAGNEENWRLDLLEPLGEIAAARDKELTGLDKVEEVVGVRRRHARLPRGVKRRLDRVLAAESPATGPALP